MCIYCISVYIIYIHTQGDGMFFTTMIYPKISWVLIPTSWILNFHRQNSQLKKNAHPQKTRVGHRSYLNGWGFCSPWNWRLTPESVGHLNKENFHLPTIGMFRGLKLAALGFLGSEIRVPFLVAKKIPAAIQGAQSGMAASAEHGDVPFSAKLRMFW